MRILHPAVTGRGVQTASRQTGDKIVEKSLPGFLDKGAHLIGDGRGVNMMGVPEVVGPAGPV